MRNSFLVLLFFSYYSQSQTYHFNKLTSEIYNGGYTNDTLCTSFTIIVNDTAVIWNVHNKCGISYLGDGFESKFKIISRKDSVIQAIDQNSKPAIITISAVSILIKYPVFFEDEIGIFTFEK